MIFKNNKGLCALCLESVVCRTLSVKRHFETIHKTLLTKSAGEQKNIFHVHYEIKMHKLIN